MFIKKIGNAVVLMPDQGGWKTLFDSLDQFSQDFMASREQPEQQVRENAFEGTAALALTYLSSGSTSSLVNPADNWRGSSPPEGWAA